MGGITATSGGGGGVNVQDVLMSVYNYVQNFDGWHLPVMHDYPWTFVVPGGAVVVYLLMVFGLQKWMEGRKPMEFPLILRLWNLFMSVLALSMLVGLAWPILHIAVNRYHLLSDPLSAVYNLTCCPDYALWYFSS